MTPSRSPGPERAPGGITLGQKEAFERIVTGKEPEKLLPVLNREEIVRFLGAVAGLRNRVVLTTAYRGGFAHRGGPTREGRLDSERMVLPIEGAKGREGPLSES
jgi:integrase/recombinase XerD